MNRGVTGRRSDPRQARLPGAFALPGAVGRTRSRGGVWQGRLFWTPSRIAGKCETSSDHPPVVAAAALVLALVKVCVGELDQAPAVVADAGVA